MCTCLQNWRGASASPSATEKQGDVGNGAGGGGVKVTKGCKHARGTLINTQRGMTGFVETLWAEFHIVSWRMQ